jgi:two-component system phosphate regulon sensor histidine kinase PhoR
MGETARAPMAGSLEETGRSARRSRHRRRIIYSELALTIAFTLATALAFTQRDALASVPGFLAGWVLNLLVLALCCTLPWSRIPSRWVIVMPLVDFVAVGISRASAGESLTGVGLLAAFPVVWIAASRVRTGTAVAVSALASLAIIWLPLAFRAEPVTFDELVDPVLLPVMFAGLAWFVGALTKENRRRQEALRASQAALRANVEAGRARERLLGTVLDTVSVGLLALDAGGHDILMNARQREAHAAAAPPGNDDPNEADLLIFGADRVTPVPPEERPVRRAVLGEDLDAEQVWVGSGRGQRAFNIYSHAMHDDDGAFAGTVVSFNDVTELVLALQAKDDFLSNVSHEFRTPLTSILGYLELTLEREDDLPDGVAEHLQVARRNAVRLERLVEDLLAINAGSFRVDPVPTDVGRLLADAASSGYVRATRAGLRLVNRAPSYLPAVVDPMRLGQAVDNLLTNAVKYNRRGGSITLDARRGEDGLVIEVEDTGIGIESEDLHRIFDRFFRSPTVRATAVPGVGLGLLITKTIVSEHQGSITVTSERGKGTCFTILIPQPAMHGVQP